MRIQYDTGRFPFRKVVEEYLCQNELQDLHRYFPFEDTLKENTDQNQYLHRLFYENLDNDSELRFIKIYESFVTQILLPKFGAEIAIQRFPTFRIHQPHNICVFKWHRDRDFGHSPHEVNCFLPITPARDSNSFYYESSPGLKDFKPMNAEYGELVIWDGANCEHGNKTNITKCTRVSFDFRFIKLKHLNTIPNLKSKSRNLNFDENGYFKILSTQCNLSSI